MHQPAIYPNYVLTVNITFYNMFIERYTIIFDLVGILFEIIDCKKRSFTFADQDVKQFYVKNEQNVLEVVKLIKYITTCM